MSRTAAMPERRAIRRVTRERIIAALGVAVLGLAAFFSIWRPAEPTYRLTMTAGSAQGLRHQMGLTLASEARSHRIFLGQKPTAGSDEALNQVESGAVDLALVQGCLDFKSRKNVRQVAALHLEPLHLLVKDEIYDHVSNHPAALRGKTVNLSEKGSGTYALAVEVLRFVGLDMVSEYTPTTLSYAELLAQPDRSKLPDAVFMVSLLPSSVAKHLVVKHRYRLVALPFASAFSLGALGGAGELQTAVDVVKSGHAIERSYVYDTTIPAFTYGVEPAVPPSPIRTLGTRLLLVAHKDLEPDAVRRIVAVVFTSRFARLAHPPLEPALLELPPELPLHEGTLDYLGRNKPLITENVVDLVEKEVSIAGGVLGALFFLWQWLRRSYRRRRELGFGHYLLRVMEIERRAQELEIGAVLDLKALLDLQQAISRLKTEALERFAEGELEGEELMSGFLAHVNDVRGYLTRLILHVRDNLEGEAQIQGRSADALWHEALEGPAKAASSP